jgi:hypothetical protein
LNTRPAEPPIIERVHGSAVFGVVEVQALDEEGPNPKIGVVPSIGPTPRSSCS